VPGPGRFWGLTSLESVALGGPTRTPEFLATELHHAPVVETNLMPGDSARFLHPGRESLVGAAHVTKLHLAVEDVNLQDHFGVRTADTCADLRSDHLSGDQARFRLIVRLYGNMSDMMLCC
jgi:hypothetical protein